MTINASPVLWIAKAIIIFGLTLILHPVHLYGQRELSTTNNRARRAFNEAIQKYNARDFEGAEKDFLVALGQDPEFIEAFIVMGEMYQNMDKHAEAVKAFSRANAINPDFFPNVTYYLATSQLSLGRYENAAENFETYMTFEKISEEMRQAAARNRERALFAAHAVANPVPFTPMNVGSGINSEHDEYAPTLTADEQTLIFTRKKPRTNPEYMHFGIEYEDFYVSRRVDGQWGAAENLGHPINTPRNEGAQSLSPDGQHLYFTACNRPDGMGSCDIYYARRTGQGWSQPVNLGAPINTSAWDSQPSISPDGQTLFFTSARRGNYGRMDIWMSVRQPDGNWGEPENLGDVINTSGREMSPFIHPDNRTLFFASDGHLGMGGMDLFYTTRQADGTWAIPKNLGYPINTTADEISLVVGASGREAYFASEMDGGKGGSDIYFFELYEEARPTPVTYMKGFVFDAQTRQRLRAEFELLDLQSGEMVAQSYSDERTGEFLVPIPVGRNLGLNVSREGYLFFSENFSYTDVRTGIDPHLYDIPLQPIREGESVVLRNIFFKTASHELLPESVKELGNLMLLLNRNPGMNIQISGHTDNVGSYDYNLQLSKNRARSVYDYLVENGISSARLSFEGYADTRPIETNQTEEGRARNRRTEFRVMGNKNP